MQFLAVKFLNFEFAMHKYAAWGNNHLITEKRITMEKEKGI